MSRSDKEVRVFARTVSRTLTGEELKQVSGGGWTSGTTHYTPTGSTTGKSDGDAGMESD